MATAGSSSRSTARPASCPSSHMGPAEESRACVSVSGTEVADDWAERWREFHRPVLVGERVWVRPPWAEPRAGALDLVIDPAQAFGTGAHPTTRLSLELLHVAPGGPLTDLGCGSGVLAIAAAALGFEPRVRARQRPGGRRGHARQRAPQRRRAGPGRAARPAQRQPPPLAPTVTANLVRSLLLELGRRMPESGDDDRLRVLRGEGG